MAFGRQCRSRESSSDDHRSTGKGGGEARLQEKGGSGLAAGPCTLGGQLLGGGLLAASQFLASEFCRLGGDPLFAGTLLRIPGWRTFASPSDTRRVQGWAS